MAAKFFTGVPLDGPDPECVTGHGEELVKAASITLIPKPSMDHSRPVKINTSRLAASKEAALRMERV
jgi:hypothetical protein